MGLVSGQAYQERRRMRTDVIEIARAAAKPRLALPPPPPPPVPIPAPMDDDRVPETPATPPTASTSITNAPNAPSQAFLELVRRRSAHRDHYGRDRSPSP